MKIYSKSHERALALKRANDKVVREHEEFLKRAEKMQAKAKTPLEKRMFKKTFRNTDEAYSRKEHELYCKYYHHIHNEFNLEETQTRFTNKKYKQGFADEKFINDLYKEKAKKQAKANKRGSKHGRGK